MQISTRSCPHRVYFYYVFSQNSIEIFFRERGGKRAEYTFAKLHLQFYRSVCDNRDNVSRHVTRSEATNERRLFTSRLTFVSVSPPRKLSIAVAFPVAKNASLFLEFSIH